MVKKYFIRKLWDPVKEFLRQGLSPKRLALTLSLGVIIGLFPVVGTTTILCFLVAIALRLNMVVIQLVNFFVYPLQLVLFMPMIRYGAWIFDLGPIPDLDFILANKLVFLKLFATSILTGVLVWFVVAVPLFILIYFLSYRALHKANASGY